MGTVWFTENFPLMFFSNSCKNIKTLGPVKFCFLKVIFCEYNQFQISNPKTVVAFISEILNKKRVLCDTFLLYMPNISWSLRQNLNVFPWCSKLRINWLILNEDPQFSETRKIETFTNLIANIRKKYSRQTIEHRYDIYGYMVSVRVFTTLLFVPWIESKFHLVQSCLI